MVRLPLHVQTALGVRGTPLSVQGTPQKSLSPPRHLSPPQGAPPPPAPLSLRLSYLTLQLSEDAAPTVGTFWGPRMEKSGYGVGCGVWGGSLQGNKHV